MAAIMNGMAAHGGVIPYGGTFLVFSDYARNALAHGGADRPAQHLRADARLDRSRRGRPHAPADRAPREPAPDAEHATSGGRAIPSRPPSRGPRRSSGARARRASCSRGRICRTCRARRSKSRRSRAAATSSAVAPRRRRSRSSPRAPSCSSRSAPHSELAKSGVAVRVVSMPCTQAFDRAVRRIPQSRVAAERCAARRRSRRHRQLVALRRRARRRDRHRSLRPFGARQAAVRAIRFHRRSRRRRRASVCCSQPSSGLPREASCPSKSQSTVTAASAVTFSARSTRASAPTKSRSSPSTTWATPRRTRI